MKLLAMFAMLALPALSALGFVGATEEQCRRKYSGKVTEVNVDPIADKTLIWKDGPKEVLICFVEGQAHYIIHMKTGGTKFRDVELKEIMKDNGGGQEWVEITGTPNPGWIRADRKVMLTKHLKLNGYTLATSRWTELQATKVGWKRKASGRSRFD